MTLATYDLFNTAGRQFATQLAAGKSVRWVLASRAQILRAIKSLYGVGAETFDELLKARGGSMDELFTDKESVSDINANDPEASVVKFVNQIIREAIAERATDIHVEPLENDLRIRYRIDGILHEAAVPQQLRAAAKRDHLALEGHGAHGHRREAPAAGRAHQSRRPGTARSTCASPRSRRSTARAFRCGC